MTELGPDPASLGLGKYDPNQPRVAAGNGSESGRWTDGVAGAEFKGRDGQPGHNVSSPATAKPPIWRSPSIIQIAANGPFSPAGINVVPVPSGDTLDPQGLNKPSSLAEQRAIADTFNTILTGRSQDLLNLNPHAYENKPSITGAFLPPPIGKYTTYYIRSAIGDAGLSRLVIDKGGQIFYTNNHYGSFYHVDLRMQPER